MKSYFRYWGLGIILLSVIFSFMGCGYKRYFDYENSWISEEPYVYIVSSGNFYKAIIEIDGTTYEYVVSHANDGSGMEICDPNIGEGRTQDSIVWDASCEIKDDLLYLTIETDNVFDYEGKTIVLHQESESEAEND